ncbi:MAG TPA: transketolase C-terminal domain-containing protein [Bryobacteraceae bacterium]|nr:transketolase C-terminal domain-containing protein [Bryobacteraceae bacterium]
MRRFEPDDYVLRQGILKLLAIKDSDIRILTLEQCRDAVDQGLHAGGAFSAIIPLVALFYGGFLRIDVENPTSIGQDLFVLSKGHAVAALASIYAELGYFDATLLKNSRAYSSILNGHPGPVLPGIHLATGPMGQGLAVAQGFALAGRSSPRFDSYAILGDGELQEGPIWEAVMYCGAKRLDNLCILVDHNHGQLDIASRMVFPMPELEPVFRSFGWRVHKVDATHYEGVYAALEEFRYGERNGSPTAIICHTSKGRGAFSDFFNRHKVSAGAALLDQEIALQSQQRSRRAAEFARFREDYSQHQTVLRNLADLAHTMHLDSELRQIIGPVLTRRVPPRPKSINYDAMLLPRIDSQKEYSAGEIVTAAMKIFAGDPRVISVDSDLATTSGLEAGVGAVDQNRAFNVGVAEANMMGLGEAYAALGFNAWVSTFCPFFDWKVLRRIAVGYQERLEAMAAPDGWLSEGHGLDLTFLATAANFETRTNGATHMGNDDITIFDGLAHLKIIDVSCPRQLLAIMQWIMEGNRGLIYLRVMRTASAVLYHADYQFEFAKGSRLRDPENERAVIISSGRGVHEALAASDLCAKQGFNVGVIDMPSVDEAMLAGLFASGKLLIFAEQNNGYLWQNFLKVLYRRRADLGNGRLERVVTVNALNSEGRPRFIHSGTYEELIEAFGLSPAQLARTATEAMLHQAEQAPGLRRELRPPLPAQPTRST